MTGAAGSIGGAVPSAGNFGVERLILLDNAETPMRNIRLGWRSAIRRCASCR